MGLQTKRQQQRRKNQAAANAQKARKQTGEDA